MTYIEFAHIYFLNGSSSRLSSHHIYDEVRKDWFGAFPL